MERGRRPRGRKKNITGGGKDIHRRGEGLHMGGPVGNPGDPKPVQNRGMRKSLPPILLILLLLFGGGGGALSTMLGGSGIPEGHTLYSGMSGAGGWTNGDNRGMLITKVADGVREKRTKIVGDGKDKVTVMVYMCGTDLESRSGMATSDLQEMAAANLGKNVNVIVYTGGCAGWRNDVISSKTNQIYQVKDGGLTRLVKDAGNKSMTDPDTLTEFIKWCTKNYPANRQELILWDHGGGSISGYGYDECFPRSGSMTLSGINEALKNAKTTFDFIGFDACLMATMENALMLSQYADYMIASEETEPGIGWYYTNWLTQLSKNTSMPTIEMGKMIADDFVNACAQKCAGQQTTLSVVDLAELEEKAPKVFREFSKSTNELIQKKEYRKVSNARSETREFARSNGIDQVDLIHFADNLGTEEAKNLASILLNAVKYNQTSDNMTNAYGLSIYFPSKKVSAVDNMVDTYEDIGIDKEYSKCIRQFASLEVGGQVASGGTGNPLSVLLGNGDSGSASGNAELIGELLNVFLSGNYSGISGLDGSNTGFLDAGRSLDDEETMEYLADTQLDTNQLTWEEGNDGYPIMKLDEEQWELIQNLELNVFYDDGEGFIDLGLDNVFDFDEDGHLIGEYDRTWLAINGQPVAYYFVDETVDGEAYTITGRVPAMLNGDRVELVLIFDNENPNGYIAGARTDYDQGETETVARGLTELKPGDKLDFLCDYYSYEGEFRDNYYLGETMTVEEDMVISNVDIGSGDVRATYRFTDIYQQHYWSPPME